jgi:predicted permease
MLSDLYICLRSLFRRSKVEEELDDELRFHREQQADKYMRAGMGREEAQRQVRLDFGGLEQVKEDCRGARGISFIESVTQDVRYGLRMLVKSPVFTAVIILTLALGVGANTAIFTLVNAVMLRDLPVRDPQQLVVLHWSARHWPQNMRISSFGDCADSGRNASVFTGCSLPYPLFQKIRKQAEVFADAMAFAGPSQMNLSGNGAATTVQGELVSGGYFETLGVSPVLGRTLVPDDEEPGAPAVAVLDYAYWQRAFGGSPAVIGQTIRLNDTAFTIIGITEPEFTRLTPGKSVDLWVSLSQAPSLGKLWTIRSNPDNWWLIVVGRLQPGVSRAQAQAALNLLFMNATAHAPKQLWDKTDNPRLDFLPAQQGLRGIRNLYDKPLLLLMAAVGLILLVACANVAGLMLARGATRQREMAVRLAMGAARRRIIRQLLTESLLLSFLGAAMGALLAPVGVSALATFFSRNAWSPLQLDLDIDARVLLFTLAAALLTGIGFGIAPAFRGSHTSLTSHLKGNTTTAAGHVRAQMLSLGSALVVLQVALSMVVLTGAGLLLRTLANLRRIDAGFDTQNLLIFDVNPQLSGYKDEQILRLYADLQRQIAALPGVTSVSYASEALLDGGYSSRDMKIEGRSDKSKVEILTLRVGPDYFPTMRIPLLAGRLFNSTDTTSTSRALVNRSFVTRYLADRNPLGMHFGGDEPQDPQWEIVGVVGDTKFSTPRSDDAPTAFMPLAPGGVSFEVRTASAPTTLMRPVRNIVSSVDTNLPVLRMRTQSDSIDRLLFNERLVARLLSLFAALGLMLACIGLYGLLSYEVECRTREIGIRSALGALRSTIWSMVVRQGILLVALGAIAGGSAAFGATRLLTSLLYAVRPTDPVTFALTACLLLLVGTLACLLPARRATCVDPISALRCE